MTDITVIILVGNEERHIGRCLEKLKPLEPRQIIVVESQKGDRTHEKAIEVARQLQWKVEVEGRGLGKVELIFHEWPGNQAAQFNWVLEKVEGWRSKEEGGGGEWILRLDADEYLYPETIEELKKLVTEGGLPPEVTSLSLSLARRYWGEDVKYGAPELVLVRAFKRGYARYADNMEMDEHLVVKEGQNYKLKGKFVDDSLMTFEEWKEKHRQYAKREARMAVEGKANKNKALYYKLPPYLRAIVYFCIRYFLYRGFLDGKIGLKWNFWQGLWYRCLVDKEIAKLKRKMI